MPQVYVAHLSHGVNEEQLSRVFSDFGEVVHVRIIIDRDTGQPKGYAFVTMASPAQAQVCSRSGNGRQACVWCVWSCAAAAPVRLQAVHRCSCINSYDTEDWLTS